MKKKILTLAAVAVFAFALTACGTPQTGNTPTSTPEPTVEAQTPVEPTATSTPKPSSRISSTASMSAAKC